MSEGKVYEGSHFLFVRPGNEEIFQYRSAGSDEKTVPIDRPTVISLDRGDIQIDDYPLFRGRQLSRNKLITVITDRKIYRKGQQAKVFIFSPHFPGVSAELQLSVNGHCIQKESVTISREGFVSHQFLDLEEGMYALAVKAEEVRGTCEFSVAEYSLSFLRASLLRHEYSGGTISFALSLCAGHMPYSGSVEAGLYCDVCRRVVLQETLCSRHGEASGSFQVSRHGGPFTLVITTPAGDTATVPIPNTELTLREKIPVCRAGKKIAASLLSPDLPAERVRGIYLCPEGEEQSFLSLDGIVGEKVTVHVNRDLEHLLLEIHEPLQGSCTAVERRLVKKGDSLSIEVPYPLGILTAGAIGPLERAGTCEENYETSAFLLRPDTMDLTIEAPGSARPGEEVEITISSRRRGALLLVIADSRLEREDPFNRLSASLFQGLKAILQSLSGGIPREVLSHSQRKLQEEKRLQQQSKGTLLQRLYSFIFRNDPSDVLQALPGKQMAVGSGAVLGTDSGAARPESVVQLMVASPFRGNNSISSLPSPGPVARLHFPEVLFAEVLPFAGCLTQKIRLGEQIGSFNVYAFLMENEDFASAEAAIETSLQTYAELDIPSLISPGDRILGRVHARCPGLGLVSIRTSTTSREMEMNDSAMIEFPLDAPGEVAAEIHSPSGADVTSRVVTYPGRETITVSRVIRLRPGEFAEGERIHVYPSAALFLEGTVSSLIQYPFG